MWSNHNKRSTRPSRVSLPLPGCTERLWPPVWGIRKLPSRRRKNCPHHTTPHHTTPHHTTPHHTTPHHTTPHHTTPRYTSTQRTIFTESVIVSRCACVCTPHIKAICRKSSLPASPHITFKKILKQTTKNIVVGSHFNYLAVVLYNSRYISQIIIDTQLMVLKASQVLFGYATMSVSTNWAINM